MRNFEIWLHDEDTADTFVTRRLLSLWNNHLARPKKWMQYLTDVAWSVLSIQASLNDCPWQQPTLFHSKSPRLSQPVQMMSLRHWYTSLALASPRLETFTNHNTCGLPIRRAGNSKHPGESLTAVLWEPWASLENTCASCQMLLARLSGRNLAGGRDNGWSESNP